MKHPAQHSDIEALMEVITDNAGTCGYEGRPLLSQEEDKITQAIQALIDKAVVEARINEVKKLWGHAREHTITDIEMIMHQTGGRIDFIEAVDTKHFEHRIAQLKSKKES